ncbi:Major Facilitator Superfamily protein [Trichomonas vaginalis G3]|uniref:Major Facilitator Superfamily protein n=1 Tax=Trichomonas vaginalis (strain ATCC PRA-98 / G3) TaxID=412133 RepID=A2D7Z3_TRIV3|nr:major facilitator superfamily transporter [Trichomonas vaginalis G3]EAY23426.1 Major Facilitator Superfamily protein [Trichomonas vaginalis G3]KAI5493839.1 Major Facilitator Superfamily protein family [Trichomonas vaginalis G3]|eukprot:XP_001584412.1 major facilitator superfamily transporter [Trichomonas vaginalis G3]
MSDAVESTMQEYSESQPEVHYTILRIICICMSTLGFEMAFNVLFSLSEPIMASMNMSSTSQFLCWLSGPLAGVTLMPLIGVWSDNCKSRFGRRRPFIVGGCIFSVISFLLLLILKRVHEKFNAAGKTVSMLFILFFSYASINTIMAPSRALIGDIIPETRQGISNSIASVLIGLSSVLPNLVGGVGFFLKSETYSERADTVTMYFCLFILILSVIITVFASHEKPHVPAEEHHHHKKNPFVQMYEALKKMPKPIIRSCILMVLSWVANYTFTMLGTSFFMKEVFPEEQESKGLCFGMLVIACANLMSFIYGCVHPYVVNLIGCKTTYFISHIIEAVSLSCAFFVKNKWALLGLFTPIGIAITNFNSIPYELVSYTVTEEYMGVYMSILSTCIDVAYVLANLIMNLGLGNLVPKFPSSWHLTRYQSLIGFAAVWAVLTAVFSLFIIVPDHKMEVDVEEEEEEEAAERSSSSEGEQDRPPEEIV